MIIVSPSSILEWYGKIFWRHQNCYLSPSLGSFYLIIPLYQVHTYLHWPTLLHTHVCTHDRHFSDNIFKNISLNSFIYNGLTLKTCLLSLKHLTWAILVHYIYIYICLMITAATFQLLVSLSYGRSKLSALCI